MSDAAGRPIDLDDVVDAAGVGVIGLDTDGRIVTCNAHGAGIVGRTPAELIGHTAHDALHGAREEPECSFTRALAASGVVETELDDFRHAGGADATVTWLSAPLADGRGVGLMFRGAAERRATAEAFAADVERGRVDLADARRAVTELERLAAITQVLSETLDETEVLQRLSVASVASLADVVVASLLDRDGSLHRVAGAAAEGLGIDVAALFDDADITSYIPQQSETVQTVLRGSLLRVVGPELYNPRLIGDSSRRLLYRVDAHSAVIAPLRVRGRTIGLVVMIRRRGTPPFDEADELLIGHIRHRAGLAVDNARLFREQRDTALSLQTALLPATTSGLLVESAARYLPAQSDNRVGGDWYDVFGTPEAGDVTTMIIGDVAGHDIPAATTMAALRNLLRGIAVAATQPCSGVVEIVDANLPNLGISGTASVVMLTAEPTQAGTWTLRWSNAGHLAPLLVLADGSAELLDGVHGPLLGTGARAGRGEGQRVVPSGSTVVLYTDGLVERRGESIDVSIERLRAVADDVAGLRERPAELLDALIERCEPTGEDDVAVLVCHLPDVGG